MLLHGGLTSEAGKKVFIGKLDGGAAGAGALRACEKLSLSTNQVRGSDRRARARWRRRGKAARGEAAARKLSHASFAAPLSARRSRR